MAALGWLQNLDFAAGAYDAPVVEEPEVLARGGGSFENPAEVRKRLARLRLQQQRVDDDEVIALLIAAGLV